MRPPYRVARIRAPPAARSASIGTRSLGACLVHSGQGLAQASDPVVLVIGDQPHAPQASASNERRDAGSLDSRAMIVAMAADEIHLADDRRLALVVGDITTIAADAIGNAANAALVGGGGVDGAIHRAGGPAIMDELRQRFPAGTPTGTAVATGAGELPARWVIHAVGPRWSGGTSGEAASLASAYRNAVTLADELGAATLTLPAISAGIYGYPLAEAARIAIATCLATLETSVTLHDITFILRPDTIEAFRAAVARR